MNIDKFGRINTSKSLDSETFHVIDKLENMIILLKSDIIEINGKINAIFDIIERQQVILNELQYEKNNRTLTVEQ